MAERATHIEAGHRAASEKIDEKKANIERSLEEMVAKENLVATVKMKSLNLIAVSSRVSLSRCAA